MVRSAVTTTCQAQGWHLQQIAPGIMRWTTPARCHYTNHLLSLSPSRPWTTRRDLADRPRWIP